MPLVIAGFAHGGEVAAGPPRNQYSVSTLNHSGISTLPVALLTAEQQKIDEETREHRFNI
jgi:putative phosphoribosyl transferase